MTKWILLLSWLIASVAGITPKRSRPFPAGYLASRTSARRNNRKLGYGMRIEELLNPETYHKYIRPGINSDDPLQVKVTLAVSSIDEVSDVHMEYTITFTLYQTWRDDRLDKLRLAKHIKPVTMDSTVSSRMWVPDTYIVNAHTSFIHDVTTRNGLLMLYPNGTVIYVLRITSRIACPMKLFKYPMDAQVCKLRLASWSFTMDDLVYTWNGQEKCGQSYGSVTGMEKVVLPQFNVTRCGIYSSSHVRILGNYSELVMEFGLKRNVLFFIMQTYVPSVLLVILSWVSFWINVNAVPARVALGITTVLSMTTLMIGVYSGGPKSTSSVKAVDCYVLVCYGFIFAAMIEYAGVHYYLRYQTNKSLLHPCKPDASQKNDLNNKFELGGINRSNKNCTKESNGICQIGDSNRAAKDKREFARSGCFCFPPADCCRAEQKSNEMHDSSKLTMKSVENVDKLFGVLAPCLFLIFNISYWCIYLEMSD